MRASTLKMELGTHLAMVCGYAGALSARKVFDNTPGGVVSRRASVNGDVRPSRGPQVGARRGVREEGLGPHWAGVLTVRRAPQSRAGWLEQHALVIGTSGGTGVLTVYAVEHSCPRRQSGPFAADRWWRMRHCGKDACQ